LFRRFPLFPIRAFTARIRECGAYGDELFGPAIIFKAGVKLIKHQLTYATSRLNMLRLLRLKQKLLREVHSERIINAWSTCRRFLSTYFLYRLLDR